MMMIATSVNVECLFSCGHVLLSHTHNHLSSQSICALLCLRSWSVAGFVKSANVQKLEPFGEIEGNEDVELAEGWDSIWRKE